MDGSYFTHVPLLAAAMQKTTGPVLELGAGLGSTLVLHGLCAAMGRELLTLESDAAWLQRFANFGRSWHQLRQVDTFIGLPEYQREWGLALVDHGVMEQRGRTVLELRHVPVILCHDTCHFFLYGYEPALSTFKYRWNYKPHGLEGTNPMTTAVSDQMEVGRVFAEMGL